MVANLLTVAFIVLLGWAVARRHDTPVGRAADYETYLYNHCGTCGARTADGIKADFKDGKLCPECLERTLAGGGP